MDLITQVELLAGQRAAYPLVAVVLTLATQAFRKSPFTKDLWRKVPDGYRWALPVAAGSIAGFVHGFEAGRPLSGALTEALLGVFGVSFTSMGLAATLRESPVQWDGGKGGALTAESDDPPKVA